MSEEANIEAVLRRLRALLPDLRESYAVDTLEVFGSRLRSDVRPESDLDLLVTFTDTPDLITFIALENIRGSLTRPLSGPARVDGPRRAVRRL